jgi:hypothetical protein
MGKAQEKIQRIKLALAHKEPDRVPVGEFFWTGFVGCADQGGLDR